MDMASKSTPDIGCKSSIWKEMFLSRELCKMTLTSHCSFSSLDLMEKILSSKKDEPVSE